MSTTSTPARRDFIVGALAIAAAPGRVALAASPAYPQGVASGDPTPTSVVLWTRHAGGGTDSVLSVEVAADREFTQIHSRRRAVAQAESDWTVRLIIEGLEAGQVYWYRFRDAGGRLSPIGRTRTARAPDDARPFRFAFVSCQNAPLGRFHPYARLCEEEISPPEPIEFVLHLGDFIYDEVWYPEDRPDGFLGRRLRDVVRFPNGGGGADVRYPVSVDDYRALYRAYLSEPELQLVRASWPMICVWDDHEFSQDGWQSASPYASEGLGAQSRKIAANRAWFEYIPARLDHPPPNTPFSAPIVDDAPLTDFDEAGLSHEPNNLRAIRSLSLARTMRWGANAELMLTDNRSFRSRPVMDSPEGAAFATPFAWFADQATVTTLDAGRDGAHSLSWRGETVPNPRSLVGPTSMLGVEQKAWLFDRLAASQANWKIWGNSLGALYRRTDLQNLPQPLRDRWPGNGYGQYGTDDWCGFPSERSEILEFIRSRDVSGVVSLAGDRHNFFSGLLSAELPPQRFRPVATEFGVSSISTPTSFEAAHFNVPQGRQSRPIYVRDGSDGRLECTLNISVRHGVRAALAYAASGDATLIDQLSNPSVAPHLSFADMGSHGFATARVSRDAFEVEFVGMPCPLDGDALDLCKYRIRHRLRVDGDGAPVLTVTSVSGAPPLAAPQPGFTLGAV